MGIRERRSELAVMRTLGFGPNTLLLLIMIECLVLGLLGGTLGVGGAFLVVRALSLGSVLEIGSVINMPPEVMAEGLVLATIVGSTSGIVPALSAVRRNVADGLRIVA